MLARMRVIVIYICKQFVFARRFYIYKKKSFLRQEYIYFKPKYRELSWAIKMEFCIIGKSQ